MTDKFRALTIRQAIAVQIFYSSPDDENLVGKTLNGKNWLNITGVGVAIIFRKTGTTEQDNELEKLIVSRDYEKIIKLYDKPGATFKMIVVYKDEKDKLKEMNLTEAISEALSPEELPDQIMNFLMDKPEYAFLKG